MSTRSSPGETTGIQAAGTAPHRLIGGAPWRSGPAEFEGCFGTSVSGDDSVALALARDRQVRIDRGGRSGDLTLAGIVADAGSHRCGVGPLEVADLSLAAAAILSAARRAPAMFRETGPSSSSASGPETYTPGCHRSDGSTMG